MKATDFRFNPKSKIYLFCFFLALCGMILSFILPLNSSQAAIQDDRKFTTGTPEELALAEQLSRDYLQNRIAGYGINNTSDLKTSRVFVDELSMAHVRVQQTLNDVPVFGGEAIVHLKSDGSVSAFTDSLISNVFVETKPALNEKDAIERSTTDYGCSDCLTDEPIADLWILRHEGRDHLVYRVQLRREDESKDTAMPVYFIDAHTGEVVWNYDNLQTGTGNSLYSGTVSITTSSVGSTFYMEDLTRRMGTFNFNNGTSSAARFTDTNDVWDTTTQRAGVDAHYGAAATYDYYKNVHGRNGINNNNGPGSVTAAANSGISLVASRVHYSSNYNNAFWNGTTMTYGDGNGTTFSPLVTLDIAGHEMTHGVTQYTANLTYSGESGALNESMSDVFGAMVERYARGGVINADTWKVGEQCYTPANGTGDALRYMDNPHAASNGGYTADDDPDHYSERYTGSADNGGVHINSGIGNKAFYLVAVGGTHHLSGTTVTGIGANDAEKIWYRALTTYMTSSTNFAGARTATLNAATDLFGATSTQYNTVSTAWCACGVGTCGGPPSGNELIVNGALEGNSSPWVLSGLGALYTANGSYPHGGTGYLYFGAANSRTGQTYQTISIPSTATANFTFWLNVTSSETTTTTQYDRLFVEVRNTSGTLLSTVATYSNLNKGTAGVYSQKSLSLASYIGQTVRVQFRVTTDSSLPTTFRVDDVSVK